MFQFLDVGLAMNYFSCQQIRVGFGITRLYAAPMRLGAVFGLLTSLRWYNLFKCALQCIFGFIASKLPSGFLKPLGLLFCVSFLCFGFSFVPALAIWPLSYQSFDR